MLSTVYGTQERHNVHELLFAEEVTGRRILSPRTHVAWLCLSGHVSSEFKRINVQAASGGPGSRASGVLELGAGCGGPRALGVATAAVAAATAGGGRFCP